MTRLEGLIHANCITGSHMYVIALFILGLHVIVSHLAVADTLMVSMSKLPRAYRFQAKNVSI